MVQVYWPLFHAEEVSLYRSGILASIPCQESFSLYVRYIGLLLAVVIPCRGSFSICIRYIGLYLAVGIPC